MDSVVVCVVAVYRLLTTGYWLRSLSWRMKKPSAGKDQRLLSHIAKNLLSAYASVVVGQPRISIEKHNVIPVVNGLTHVRINDSLVTTPTITTGVGHATATGQ